MNSFIIVLFLFVVFCNVFVRIIFCYVVFVYISSLFCVIDFELILNFVNNLYYLFFFDRIYSCVRSVRICMNVKGRYIYCIVFVCWFYFLVVIICIVVWRIFIRRNVRYEFVIYIIYLFIMVNFYLIIFLFNYV